jgi:hypothetical protein
MHVSIRPILFRVNGADLSTPFTVLRTPRKIASGVALGSIHSSCHSEWVSLVEPTRNPYFRGALNIDNGQNRYNHGNGNGNGRSTESLIMVPMDN